MAGPHDDANPTAAPETPAEAARPPLAAEARGVDLGYGGPAVVRGFDLDLAPGEMVALLGPSGSGKSTILGALAGFIGILAGEVRIGGRVVAQPGRHEPPERRDVAVVFQNAALWPHMTALETVAYPVRRRGVAAEPARRDAAGILERLGIAALADRRPAELSGGEQQRVGLGRALARGASLYLFDEPTAHLDADLRDQLQQAIAEQRALTRAAAVYATHDTAEALALADRVMLIRAGQVIQVGAPGVVYGRPVDMWAARLTGPASSIRLDVRRSQPGQTTIDIAGEEHVVESERDSGSAIPSGPVDVIVRPDWVCLGGPLLGRVAEVSFRGTHTDYALDTSTGRLGIRASGPPRLVVGDDTGCTIERIWIPPSTGSSSPAP